MQETFVPLLRALLDDKRPTEPPASLEVSI
jgi:hypothetical protein